MKKARDIALGLLEGFTLKLSGKFEDHHVHHGSSSAKIVHHPGGNTATVTDVHTPESERGRGHAHELMKKVTAHLDHHKKKGRLVAVAIDHGVETHRLEKLYARHGFKHSGRVPHEMVRDPK